MSVLRPDHPPEAEPHTWQVLADGRFALLRRPADGRRLIVDDKGYATPFQDPEFDVANVVFPLSPEVAVLMAVGTARPGDDYLAGPMRRLTLTPGPSTW